HLTDSFARSYRRSSRMTLASKCAVGYGPQYGADQISVNGLTISQKNMKQLWIGMGIFIFSVNILSGQAPPLPPVTSGPPAAANGLEVGSATKHDVSPPLRSIAAKL